MRLGPAAVGRQVVLGSFLVLAAACWMVACARGEGRAAGEPREVAVGAARFPIVQMCDAEQYDCSLQGAPGKPLRVYWGWQDAGNHYRLDVTASQAALACVEKGRERRLASTTASFLRGGTPTDILLRRRAHALYVVLNGRIALDCLDATFAAGPVAGRHLKAAAFQPTEDVFFSDDFMRTEKEQQLGAWAQVSGTWRFHSVKETNVNADLRLSVNPFSLGGKGPNGALVAAGFPFWNDYTFGASLRSEGAVAGIAFACRSPKDYFLFRLDLRHARPAPSGVELLRVTPSGVRTLASGSVQAASFEWYRLQVRTFGPRIQAVLDGDVLFDVVEPECLGGPVGLYTQGDGESFFDDIRVEGSGVYPFDRAQALRRSGHPEGAGWRVAAAPGARIIGDTGPHVLVHEGKAPARYLFGSARWQAGVVETRVRARGAGGWAGLLFGCRNSADWYLARWRVGGGLQVIRCAGGRKQVVARSAAGLRDGAWHDLQVDCTPAGHVHVSLDGRLRVRLAVAEAPGGYAGAYTLGLARATFERPTLRTAREVQIEEPVPNEVFRNDPYMRNWSSAHGQWYPAKTPPNTYWHKGDFLNSYSISLPAQPGIVLSMAAPEQDASQGYRVSIEPAKGEQGVALVYLNRLDRVVKSARIAVKNAGAKLVVCRGGDVVWATYEAKELFCLQDPEPLAGRHVGVAGPRGFDVGTVDVRREDVADYPFEQANCDWHEYGTWVVTNRFFCTPTWSHLTAIGDRACVLWNKYAFEGDLTVEFYAGMRMQAKAMNYPRVGDMNVTLCGDGRDLSTGYSYLVGAWDEGWTEKWTRLLRRAQSVAQTDRYLAPRMRESSGGRQIDVPWVADGRPVHGAWYYIKLRRVGKRVECFFDNEKVLTYDDPDPLSGRFLALWTQMSEVVVARASVTYQRRSAPRRLLSAALPGGPLPSPVEGETRRRGDAETRRQGDAETDGGGPAPALASQTHPGILADFEAPGSAWPPTGPLRDVAVERAPGGPAGSGGYLRVTNSAPGGDLGVKVPLGGVPVLASRLTEPALAPPQPAIFPLSLDAARTYLELDYRIPRDAKIHLYVTFAGRRHFVRLNGDDGDSALLPLLGTLPILADDRWHHASFDLGAAVAERYPGRKGLTIQELAFGHFHEGYLRAGIGGNGPGVSYGLDNVAVATSSGAAPVLSWSAPVVSPPIPPNSGGAVAAAGSSPQARGARGAAPVAAGAGSPRVRGARGAAPAAAGAGSPRVRGARGAAPAAAGGSSKQARGGSGAAPAATAFALSVDHSPAGRPGAGNPVTETTTTLKDLEDGLWVAHVRCRLADGSWSGTAHLPFRLAARAPTPQPLNLRTDGTWGGEPLLFRLGEGTAPHIDPARTALTVGGRKVRSTAGVLAYDREKRELSVDLQRAGLQLADKQPVEVGLQVATMDGAPVDTRVPLVMSFAQDHRPPERPALKGAGIAEGFEDGTGTWSRSSAYVDRDTTTAASGKASLRITNPALAGSFAAIALGRAFNVGHTPLLRFAYRVPEGVCINPAIACAQGTVGISFTDNGDSYPVLGRIDGVKRDDQWHTGEVNLRQALSGLRFGPAQYEARALVFGDRGYNGVAPGASYWIDDFQLVPAASGTAGVAVSWSAADTSGIQAYRCKWSARADDTPDSLMPGTTTSRTFTGLPEGPAYFHLQAQDGAGNWSEVTHTPFLLDNTPPAVGAPAPAPGKLSGSLWSFPLDDAGGSGCDPASLQVSVNGQARPLREFVATYDAAMKRFVLDWPLATGLFSDPVPDGQRVEIALAPVKDFAGNAAPGATYAYTVDRAGDREPPRAPELQAPGPVVVCRDTFTTGLGSWAAYSGFGGVERILDPERGDYCALLSTSATSYGYTINPSQVDAVKTPWVAFEYRCPPGVNLHLMLYSAGAWYAIPLNGRDPTYTNLEQAPGFVADGRWHTIAFNYLDIMRRGGISSPSVPITYFALWHNGSPGGQVYSIDNFQVFGSGGADLTVGWQAADTTGIHAYRYRVDADPNAGLTLEGAAETADKQAALTGLKPGLWFIRVRARDGAGNWSAPALLAHHVRG